MQNQKDELIKLDFKLHRKKPQLLRKIETDIKKFLARNSRIPRTQSKIPKQNSRNSRS